MTTGDNPARMTKVEEVARALYECWPEWDSGEAVDGFQVTPAGPVPWSAIVEMDDAEPYFVAARAAIAAMREPTSEMLDASRRALGKHICSLPKAEREAVVGKKGGFRVYDEALKARVRYQAMVDAILAQHQAPVSA